jgi:GT2 family glycosyltransferase
MRKLDIGVAVYGGAARLRQTIFSIQQNSVTDYRLMLVVNPHPDPAVQADVDLVINFFLKESDNRNRIVVVSLPENMRYAGAVNEILAGSDSEYIAYADADIQVISKGWDETLCSYLDRFHEIGMIFPNGGAYQIDRGNYQEILWGVGFCWVINRMVLEDAGFFDIAIGHQEEADYCQRLRMAGWKCAAAPEVVVVHNATSTSDPSAITRINKGVQNWVTKWVHIFLGQRFDYFSPNVLRFEDWPCNAIYLEEYWKLRLPGLNDNPEVKIIDGREYDLIRVPRLKGFYRGRII